MYNDASFLHVFGYVYGYIFGLTGLSVCISYKPHVTELCFFECNLVVSGFCWGNSANLRLVFSLRYLLAFPPFLIFLIRFCWLLFPVSSAIFVTIALIVCFKVIMLFILSFLSKS